MRGGAVGAWKLGSALIGDPESAYRTDVFVTFRGEVLSFPLAGRRLPAIAQVALPFGDLLIQSLMPNVKTWRANHAFCWGLTGLNVQDGNSLFLSPFQLLFPDVSQAILDP